MKKIFGLILSIILALSLVACTGVQTVNAPSENPTQSIEPTSTAEDSDVPNMYIFIDDGDGGCYSLMSKGNVIYDEENGFACSNVALGVGSFSFQCIEEDGILKPFTRDTFSSCIKATYCEIDGVPTPIFKNPKDGGFKKSQKGCCVVHQINEAGDLVFEDGKTWEEASNDKDNMLDTIFVDGKMTKEYTLAEVRAILHGGKF